MQPKDDKSKQKNVKATELIKAKRQSDESLDVGLESDAELLDEEEIQSECEESKSDVDVKATELIKTNRASWPDVGLESDAQIESECDESKSDVDVKATELIKTNHQSGVWRDVGLESDAQIESECDESKSGAESLDEEESQSEVEESQSDAESMDKEESESESDTESMEEEESDSTSDESESEAESEPSDDEKSESESESEAESMDEEESTSELDSESDCSWDTDENFFKKPVIIEAKKLGPIKIDLIINLKKVVKPLCITEEPVDADIAKVSVFDGMSEADIETQNVSAQTLKDEALNESNDGAAQTLKDKALNESNDEAESEKEPVAMSVEIKVDNSENNDEEDIEMQLSPMDEGRITETPRDDLAGFMSDYCIFENSFKTNNVLAVIKQDIELYGTVTLTLLCGRLTINGYKARRYDSLTIYSPKGFNWVVISPMSNRKPIKLKMESSSTWKVLEDSFTRAQLDNIERNYDGYRDAIVLMQRNSSAQNMLHIIGKHMVEKVFPSVNTSNRPYATSEYILNCLIQSADTRQALRVPRAWMKLKVEQHSRWMVAGGKGVGKSTLLRYMLNRHLEHYNRILFIDLDIGQPELFVPQTVSCHVIDRPLLGAGFFFNKQPDRAYAVGHVNVVMCAEQYIQAVRELVYYCKVNPCYDDIPWLINTMGYNKGFGRELMALLIDCVDPTDLIQISSPKAINNFEITLDPESLAKVRPIIYTADEFKVETKNFRYKLHQLQSALPQLEPNEHHWRMSPKDVRYANFLARLSSALNGNAKHLTDCQPVSVDLDELNLVHLVSKDYAREELIAGMEANLVYLCRGQLGDDPKQCLGIGVVRAIDYEKKQLYLVPAMPLERLWLVDCLVLGGAMCLPQGFFKDQGTGVANNVPFVFIIDDNRSSKSIQQIYFRPNKQAKTNTEY
ncbi:hypothetical protein AWZ03_006479 [Drosophila navojoa]|uniref:Polynucleotide 5'-hydroxyl-kinase NOL9 n=1 Tax=Drosophila navojoa TaxID=7232 RepID=A0A484BFH7_DRONA|nr:polynucleotide 5'-hydroxyl-kinase NOL9 [Drosophila navojoa]TDG47042.1 hypothetical protein AWZ03_006479 [Drosophila navojoa]